MNLFCGYRSRRSYPGIRLMNTTLYSVSARTTWRFPRGTVPRCVWDGFFSWWFHTFFTKISMMWFYSLLAVWYKLAHKGDSRRQSLVNEYTVMGRIWRSISVSCQVVKSSVERWRSRWPRKKNWLIRVHCRTVHYGILSRYCCLVPTSLGLVQVRGHTSKQGVAASTSQLYCCGPRLADAQAVARPVMSVILRLLFLGLVVIMIIDQYSFLLRNCCYAWLSMTSLLFASSRTIRHIFLASNMVGLDGILGISWLHYSTET